MQLSSRILTALAVLILAVTVVAVRAGSTGGVVEAATGTIDVLNVGTCYTTNIDVFALDACDDGDGDYEVAGRDTISEVGTVYATYSHDPKTSADNPRGILYNSDLVKISIQDTGRDKRTPVLLPVGDTAPGDISKAHFDVIKDVVSNIADSVKKGSSRTEEGLDTQDVLEKTTGTGDSAVMTYDLEPNMRWDDDVTEAGSIGWDAGVKNGLRVIVKGANPPEYLPMDDGDNAVIKFFGCVSTNANSACTSDSGDEQFRDLKGILILDEDRGPGRTAALSDSETGTAIAPWLNVHVNAPGGGKNIVLKYIVYNTSERETLRGGWKMGDYGTGVYYPDFAKSETALTVKVMSDGNTREQNLHLYETGRFTGRYEGYVRLTDADGNGASTSTPVNWGLMTKDASSEEMDGAAVIGVESGPVTIEYVNTDGRSQTHTIQIDAVPPMVQVDTPAHKSQDQDTSPEFAGSYTDLGSGLRADSFQLYVDNANDSNENGDSSGSVALNLRVDSPVTNEHGYVKSPGSGTVIRSPEDYMGYGETGAKPQFGVIKNNMLYGLATDGSNLLKVDGDRFSDGADTGTFADSVRIRILDNNNDEVNPYNHTIDFHALVADVAGNIGFSDSDDTGPRFINDYGKETTGDDRRKTGRYNVLGWYARHIFFLDEKDPEVYQEQSVTGFYGVDDDDKPMVNRSGILIAFDAAVDPDTVNRNTFAVTLDPVDPQDRSPPMATVRDITVEGRQVYLLLNEELASDATPSVDLASGQSVYDPAGNRLSSGELSAFEVKDGIAPKLTVILSGGSGTGEGEEAADKLTNKAITITVIADEEISSTPLISVVCSNIKWTEGTGDDKKEMGLSDFTSARSGPIKDRASANFDQPDFDCGDMEDAKGRQIQQVQTFSRPGLQWEYQWQNFSDQKELPDGKLTTVAYGRDRQSYASLKERSGSTEAASDTYNWGVATAEFNFDTTKPSLNATSKPDKDATVTDPRPFILLNYDDESTVMVSKLMVDGTDRTEQVQTLGAKRFLYWPETLALGSHDVEIEAVDAAGNKTDSVKRSFKVAERETFDIKLIAGWNAVSLPANPINPDVALVFTEPIVDMVAAWDGEEPEAPWSIATRMEGEWSTHSDFATLSRITARYGYWVHAQGFVTQSVALVGKQSREDPSLTPHDLVEIPTNPGWNFVGVVDQDGDQTQANYGESLKAGETELTADKYLGKHTRAYRWDAVRSRFEVVSEDDNMMIGDGIWVYYSDDFNVAP